MTIHHSLGHLDVGEDLLQFLVPLDVLGGGAPIAAEYGGAARDVSPRASKSAARTSATLKNGFFVGGIFGGLGGVMRGYDGFRARRRGAWLM